MKALIIIIICASQWDRDDDFTHCSTFAHMIKFYGCIRNK